MTLQYWSRQNSFRVVVRCVDLVVVLPCFADMSVQIMLEQNVQTFITWTHGAQPTWLQYHGSNYPAGTLRDRPFRLTAPPPPPPQLLVLPPPPPPPPPPPMMLHPHFMPSLRTSSTPSPRGQSCPATTVSERTRRSVCRADQSHAEDHRSLTRSPKRTRTTSISDERYSWRPFTVFTSKRATRATRSRTTRCKHYCHAFLNHGRKCLSPCVRRQPGHFHCRCARHQRR